MNDTTPQHHGRAATLQPRRAREILGAALELYGRQALTLIALVAVMVAPLGVLNWRQDCSRSQGCRTTVPDGVVVSTSWWAATASVVVLLLLVALFGALLAVVVRSITARLAGEDTSLRRSLRSGLDRPGSLLQPAILVVGATAALVLLFLPGMFLSGLDGPLPQTGVAANLVLVMVAGCTSASSWPSASPPPSLRVGAGRRLWPAPGRWSTVTGATSWRPCSWPC